MPAMFAEDEAIIVDGYNVWRKSKKHSDTVIPRAVCAGDLLFCGN